MKKLIALATLCILSAFCQGIPQGANLKQLTNSQTGTSYTYVTGDFGKLVTHANAAAIAGTLPQCGATGFAAGFNFDAMNTGAGTLTITPTTSTIDGVSTLVLTTGSGAHVVCDGTNYNTWHGGGSGSGGSDGAWINVVGGVGLQNSWTAPGEAPAYEKDRTNRVWLRGYLVPGTNTTNTIIFTLPSGFRPPASQLFIVPSYSGGASFAWSQINILTTGEVELIRGDASNVGGDMAIVPVTTFLSIDGLSFSLN